MNEKRVLKIGQVNNVPVGGTVGDPKNVSVSTRSWANSKRITTDRNPEVTKITK
jgi:hypothetical protein